MKRPIIISVLFLVIVILISTAAYLKKQPTVPGLPQTGAIPYPLMRLSHHDTAPDDLFPDLALAATVTVDKSGKWSDIFLGQELKPDDLVLIPAGFSVEYDVLSDIPITAVIIKGDLHFSTASNTKMTVGTVELYPGGKLTVMPDSAAITSEIVFSGTIDTAKDPTQTLLGLLALGGTVNIVGTSANPAFTSIGSTSEAVPEKPDPTGWKYHGTVARTLSFPLTRAEALAQAGYSINTVRNVIIRSAGTRVEERGHILFTGMTAVTVKNASIINLGRTTVEITDDASFSTNGEPLHIGTNQRGRYALHAHHLEVPFVFDGNLVDGSPKWGIVNHVSFGSITNNVVASAAGAGIVCEEGLEAGLVANNLVIGTGGGSGLSDDERFGSSNGKNIAHGGFGYWFRGPFMDIRDNAAIGYFPEGGFTLFVHPGFTRTMMPEIPGMPADLSGKMGADLIARGPIRLFSGNKAVGYFGAEAFSIFYSLVPQTIDKLDLTIFGTSFARGVLLRHSNTLLIKDSILRGGGLGPALESSPTAGQISTTCTTIEGFK